MSSNGAASYETVETDDRRLPLLAPMSEIAGRLAPQAAAAACGLSPARIKPTIRQRDSNE